MTNNKILIIGSNCLIRKKIVSERLMKPTKIIIEE